MNAMYGTQGSFQSASGKPLPNPDDPLSAPHWAAAREDRLVFQRCMNCGYVRWPAAKNCPECLSSEAEWTQLSGRGRLWSFCTYEHALNEAFAQDAPYVVAAVQLDEGPYLMTNIVESTEGLEIGQLVEAVFDHVTDKVSLVKFKISK